MGGRVFVFGSINTDLVVYVAKLPEPGETVSGGTFARFPGGKGANQAVAAARSAAGHCKVAVEHRKVAVDMFGCLGDDAFGRERLASLSETGISTKGIQVSKGAPSGIAQITVDARGENTIVVAPGANLLFKPEGIAIPRVSRGEMFVSLFQNEVPQEVTESLIAKAKSAGHMVLWNIAPTVRKRPRAETLRAVDCLICNTNELAALELLASRKTRKAAWRKAAAKKPRFALETRARALLDWGVGSVIVTLGRRGCVRVSGSSVSRQKAFPVDAIDTVGAGDCFCGALAASLAGGSEMAGAILWATAAAALSTTRRGAQTSMPAAEEIEEFLRRRVG